MDPLRRRLHVLEQERGCCIDLDALLARVPPLDAALTQHEALADRSRLMILALLARQEGLCGCEFQVALELSHATISHHMRILQDAGLITGERRGRWVHYALTPAGHAKSP